MAKGRGTLSLHGVSFANASTAAPATSVPWWSTTLLEPEAEAVAQAVRDRRIAMGPVTETFEREFADRLGVAHALAVPSGSVALLMALLAHGVGPGDEVIVPNRTFIATAHAVLMAGATPVLAEVRADVPLLDLDSVAARISPHTRALLPVHLNGRAVDMEAVNALADRHGLVVIEDACQALFSRRGDRWLGTESDAGCYSLGVAKLITCGYGGVVVCHAESTRDRLIALRNHGVLDTSKPGYGSLGFNFKFSDMMAAIARVQLERAQEHGDRVTEVYRRYRAALSNWDGIQMIPVDIEAGEVPLYPEVVTANRASLRAHLADGSIQCQDMAPSLHLSPHLAAANPSPAYARSERYDESGLILPGGPSQPLANVDLVISHLQKWSHRLMGPEGAGT